MHLKKEGGRWNCTGWAVMCKGQAKAVGVPWMPTLEVEVGEGRVESIDVGAEVPFLQERVMHRPGRALLCQHLHATRRGCLCWQRGVLADARLASGFVGSLSRRKQRLVLGRLLHERA